MSQQISPYQQQEQQYGSNYGAPSQEQQQPMEQQLGGGGSLYSNLLPQQQQQPMAYQHEQHQQSSPSSSSSSMYGHQQQPMYHQHHHHQHHQQSSMYGQHQEQHHYHYQQSGPSMYQGQYQQPPPPPPPQQQQQSMPPMYGGPQQQQQQQQRHYTGEPTFVLPPAPTQQFDRTWPTRTGDTSDQVMLSMAVDSEIPDTIPTQRFQNSSIGGRSLAIYMEPKDKVWIRLGSMIAYNGKVSFSREGLFDHGISNALKEAFTSEGMELVAARCAGKTNAIMYCAHEGKKCLPLYLGEREAISVNGDDVLAFESTCKWNISMIKSIGGRRSAGLYNVTLKGPGYICILSAHDPLVIPVHNNAPVRTDPDNTIAWSHNLRINFRTDLKLLKILRGSFSGEESQMEFSGEGFVVVQPELNGHQQAKKDKKAAKKK